MEEDAPVNPPTAFATRFLNQLHRYRILLRKFWWVPLLATGLGLGIQSYLRKHTPPTFASAGRMIVNVKLSIPNANVYSEEFNYFYGTQVALMQGDSVVGRVRARLEAEHPELRRVPVQVEVGLSPKTSIFNLRAVGEDADYVQGYLKAVMEEYIKLKRELLANASSSTQSSIAEELKSIGMELQRAKDVQLQYQSSNSVVFLQASGGNNAADYLADLTRQLARRRTELHQLESLTLDQNLERLQQMAAANRIVPTTNAAPAHDSLNPAALQNLNADETPFNLGTFEEAYLETKRQLLLLKGRRDELAGTLTNTAPLMVGLNSEIAHQEKQLAIYRQQSEEQLKNRQRTLEVGVKDYEAQVKEWEGKALDVSKKLAGFEALKENVKRLQSAYDSMQSSLQTLDANKGISQESVTILEPATPTGAVSPETQKHLLMAGLIGLFLGIGILALINHLDDRINSFTELEQHFDLPVLGQIPLLEKSETEILKPDDDRYLLVEANRSLRSAFLYKDSLKHEPAKPVKSLVITSACPNDGKSLTSANFAITLAEGGARVLLIDADLRRGMLHKLFSVDATKPGLSEVLGGECAWSKAVVQTATPNLSLLARGKIKRHAGNAFAASDRLLKQMNGSYDYIIFDSAPVMVADDVLSLAPHLDGLILVVRAGVTPARMARASLNHLRQRHVNIIGLAFNAVNPKSGDYYQYRYPEYYSDAPVT
jgi:capsular exopolysaccharide synthesis family protein